jgi:hypothetical protein
MGDKLNRCRFCNCCFCSPEDLRRHLEFFGDKPHRRKVESYHRYLESEVFRLHSRVDVILRELVETILAYKKSLSEGHG